MRCALTQRPSENLFPYLPRPLPPSPRSRSVYFMSITWGVLAQSPGPEAHEAPSQRHTYCVFLAPLPPSNRHIYYVSYVVARVRKPPSPSPQLGWDKIVCCDRTSTPQCQNPIQLLVFDIDNITTLKRIETK